MPWRALTADPNSPAAFGARRAVLRAARAEVSLERREVIGRYCAARRVLDIGCLTGQRVQLLPLLLMVVSLPPRRSETFSHLAHAAASSGNQPEVGAAR